VAGLIKHPNGAGLVEKWVVFFTTVVVFLAIAVFAVPCFFTTVLFFLTMTVFMVLCFLLDV
jgi:hypothetical protein